MVPYVIPTYISLEIVFINEYIKIQAYEVC